MTWFTRFIELLFLMTCLHTPPKIKILANGQCLPPEQCVFLDCCCRMIGNYLNVQCYSNYKDTFPKRNPQSIYQKNIDYFMISGYTFDELPSKSFDGMQIKTIEIEDNINFKRIKTDSFTGLNGIEALFLTNQLAIQSS